MLVINKLLKLDEFSLFPWNGQNRAYIKPAIWDAELPPSGYFRSGVGWEDNVYLGAINQDWTPSITVGHYFIRNYPFFAHSNSLGSSFVREVTSSGLTDAGGGAKFSVTFNSALSSYYGKYPAYLSNYQRVGDTLIPYKEYYQKRAFSHMTLATGYVDVDDLITIPSASSLEFMITRSNMAENTTIVTGSGYYGYEERTVYSPFTVNVAVNNVDPFNESITETFSAERIEVYCKLKVIPVAEVQSVVIVTEAGDELDITANKYSYSALAPSGWAMSPGLPGVVKFYNRGTTFEDSVHPLYRKASLRITYKPGLLFGFSNASSSSSSPSIQLNPLVIGHPDYNLLLTNTEVDPVRINLGTERKRGFVGGHPIEIYASTEFNESPILNYPVTFVAGVSRLAFNSMNFYGALTARCNAYGIARCLYVPPKKLDDESFYANLGHYIPIVDYGRLQLNTASYAYTLNGVANVYDDDTTMRDTILFPAPKHASSLLRSVIFPIYDLDKVTNNDYVSGFGTLLIRGLKRALVHKARLTDDPKNYASMFGHLLGDETFLTRGMTSEVNFKFRVDTAGGQTLKYRPYSTESNKVNVYVNDVLVDVWNTEVPVGNYASTRKEVDLSYRVVQNDEVQFNASGFAYFNHTFVSGGVLDVVDASGAAKTINVDYIPSGQMLVRVPSGTIDPSGTIYVDYTSPNSKWGVRVDTVNTIRFHIEASGFTSDRWDIVDCEVDGSTGVKPMDNLYVPAKPIAFLQKSGSTYSLLNLSEVTDDTMIDGCIYRRLPHTLETVDSIIGYYIYTPHTDFIRAEVQTSYGKIIRSHPVGISIDLPDYMKGMVAEPSKNYESYSPYYAVGFVQDLE